VKYVVHTSTHYWWDEDQDEDNAGDDSAEADSDDNYGATEQQEHEGILDANGRLIVEIPVAVDGKHEDQDYRIEARVTDAGEREVSGHSTVLATYGTFRITAEPTSYVFKTGDPVRAWKSGTRQRMSARKHPSPAATRKPQPTEPCLWICLSPAAAIST
jgi:hypothetical protein